MYFCLTLIILHLCKYFLRINLRFSNLKQLTLNIIIVICNIKSFLVCQDSFYPIKSRKNYSIIIAVNKSKK